MSSLSLLHTQPKIVIRQGRIVRKLDMKPSAPYKATAYEKQSESFAKWYGKNKERVLEQRRKYREAKREFINRQKREQRAQARIAREHAAVRGDSGSVPRV